MAGLFQPEPQRGDAKERKETNHVGDRGHEGARRHRRIGAHPLQHHRDQDAAERAGHQVAQHGKADHQATAATPVMMAKASPLTSPTSPSRITTRNALLEPSSRVASARTATVMV